MKLSRPLHLLLLSFLFTLAACSHTPDEQQVRDAIHAAAAAAEQTDAGDFGDFLSEDFDGNSGRLDRRKLMSMLRLQHFRGDKVSVLLGPLTVEPRGDRMVADFTVTLGGGGRLLPDRLGVYKVQTAWKREDGQWRCYNASWKRNL
ncbi:MAG: hypothetical protein WBW92_02750 [Rhodanobacteraceae bacterium]